MSVEIRFLDVPGTFLGGLRGTYVSAANVGHESGMLRRASARSGRSASTETVTSMALSSRSDQAASNPIVFLVLRGISRQRFWIESDAVSGRSGRQQGPRCLHLASSVDAEGSDEVFVKLEPHAVARVPVGLVDPVAYPASALV